MSDKKKHPPIIRFYAKVGAPELTFFITLICLFFIPFIFNLHNLVFRSILITLFIFALYYLIYATNKKVSTIYIISLVFLLGIEWIQHFDVIIVNFLNIASEIFIMMISFYFVFKSIFNTEKVDINTLMAAISGYLLIGIALGSFVFIYHSIDSNSFTFANDFSTYEAYYYSFTTMSTLGYGDILPSTIGAKGLSILITLIGQFYMVIVMGLLIGKVLAPQRNSK